MKKIMVMSFFLATVYLIAGCNQKKADKVRIAIHGAGLQKKNASVFTTDMVSTEPDLILESLIDSSGNTVLEFGADQPAFRIVRVGDLEISAFSEPGDQFDIWLDSLEKPEGIRFEGDQASVNDYIVKCWATRLKHERLNDQYYFQLEPDAFLQVKKSLENSLGKLFSDLEKNTNLDPDLVAVLKSQQQLIITFFVQNYVKSRYTDGDVIAENLKRIIDKVPDDSLALKYKMNVFSLVADAYLDYKIYAPLYGGKSRDLAPDSVNRLMPATANDKIGKSAYPDFLKRVFMAKNINTYLILNGITPEIDSVCQKFRRTSKNEEYLSALRKSYDKWVAIGPGKQAPEFSGDTPDGKTISLSDLKGKVIYVDIWATWCGPCKTELPFSKKLQQSFKGNNQVVFLYLSIDESISDWKKMLERDKDFTGIHINQKQHRQPGAIWDLYLMTGIPRYILIDQYGKMVQPNASRPSSGKVFSEINEVLNRKSLVSK